MLDELNARIVISILTKSNVHDKHMRGYTKDIKDRSLKLRKVNEIIEYIGDLLGYYCYQHMQEDICYFKYVDLCIRTGVCGILWKIWDGAFCEND